MKMHLFASGLFLVTLAAACSSDPAPDPYGSVDQFCNAKAGAECGIANLCAVQTSSCTSARVSACKATASLAQGQGRTYTSSLAGACIDKTNAAYGAKLLKVTDLSGVGSMGDTCERVFAGGGKQGDACTNDYLCSGAQICDKGVCAARVVKKLSEFCSNPGEVCDTGSFCAAGMGSSQCQAKKMMGDMCNSMTAPCLETLRCNNTCSPRFAVGVKCATSDDCAPDAPYCDPNAMSICTGGVTFSAGSATCKTYGG